MAARKTTKKTGAVRKTAKKTGARKKSAPRKAASGAGEPAEAPTASEPAEKAKPGFSSLQVNLGHVFALRPPVSKTFRQADFRTARHLLQDESYESIEAAARAVAEKALELTHEGAPGPGFRGGR